MHLLEVSCPQERRVADFLWQFFPSISETHDPNQQSLLRLRSALFLLIGLFLVEMGVGCWSHSLALMADAGHVIADIGAIGLTLFATGWARRERLVSSHSSQPPQSEAWAALVNSGSLLVIALWVAIEAIHRLQSGDTEVLGLPMLLTAAVGLGVNSVNAFWLKGCCHHNLNLKSAFLHIVADAVSSIGVLIGAIVVSAWGWGWADGVISLCVSGFILFITLPLMLKCSQQVTDSFKEGASLNCDCCPDDAEKLLFPTLKELIKS
ncbi:cation diffusion facilitator family transporter [Egbenema bharatensis]|uniref:cation diffusion facilitator family transporter n=1 Tax=Egbenema bharatensis TaxID=3463334 RepID=UPI003A85B063